MTIHPNAWQFCPVCGAKFDIKRDRNARPRDNYICGRCDAEFTTDEAMIESVNNLATSANTAFRHVCEMLQEVMARIPPDKAEADLKIRREICERVEAEAKKQEEAADFWKRKAEENASRTMISEAEAKVILRTWMALPALERDLVERVCPKLAEDLDKIREVLFP